MKCVKEMILADTEPAKFKRSGLPLNLQETNNPVEVINKQLKAFASKHSLNSLGQLT
jgi:hypothetical protein